MVRPEKWIKTDQDLQVFLSSRQYGELWAFMLRLNQAVKNKRCSAVSAQACSAPVRKMLQVLEKLGSWVHEIKPAEQKGRFGNRSFRSWYSRLETQAPMLLGGVIGSAPEDDVEEGRCREDMVEELAEYLRTSFGNETRIDYGSGHEGTFLVLLYCLWKIGVFKERDDAELVLLVFVGYLKVTRLLQTKYMLEPAGSHGVWGLDDYSFLPFLWGSSQLLGSTRVDPLVIRDDRQLHEERDEYLYLDAIAFIKEVKKGPFFEHSPMLWDISQVKEGWPKINQGMIKMYKGEVWSKRQVIQHMLFGSVFEFQQKEGDEDQGAKA
eukprot:GFKZ01014268.1.p1 GENE.GFKZ01014268.1~~GFKZ01014268.1.p1  ORF type:complete len:322 (+),score=53.95 GFKZ01014268.1:157-1122(+)